MPQFDKITFFNQVFWLFVFFSGSYLLFLKVFLPKLSSVLKARAKKLQQGSDGVHSFIEENNKVSVEVVNNLGNVSSVVKSAVVASNDLTSTWVDTNKKFLNVSLLNNCNKAFEKSLHKDISVNYILSKLS